MKEGQSGVEKDGSGVEKDGSGVEKDESVGREIMRLGDAKCLPRSLDSRGKTERSRNSFLAVKQCVTRDVNAPVGEWLSNWRRPGC